jgi:hypothetical protein
MASSPFVSGSRRVDVEIERHTPEAFDPPAWVEGNRSRTGVQWTWTPAIFANLGKASSTAGVELQHAPPRLRLGPKPVGLLEIVET